jgi:hypothetical protein
VNRDRVSVASSVPPEALKSIRRKGGVARRILNVSMAQVSLQRSGVVAVVGQLVATGVSKHMGMGFDAEIGRRRGPLDHPREAWRCQRRDALRHENEWRAGTLTLVPPQFSQLATGQRVATGRARLDSPNAQDRRFEVDLLPTRRLRLLVGRACRPEAPSARRRCRLLTPSGHRVWRLL